MNAKNLKIALKTYQINKIHNEYKHGDYSIITVLLLFSSFPAIIWNLFESATLIFMLWHLLIFLTIVGCLDLVDISKGSPPIAYYLFNKNYKLRKKILKVKYIGNLSEIFDFDNPSVKNVIFKHSKKIERSLVDNKYISGEILIAICNDIAYVERYECDSLEKERAERENNEKTKAILSLKEIYELKNSYK